MLDIKEAEQMMNLRRFYGVVAVLGAGAWGCATTWKPCTDGGDIQWDPPVKGNMQCHQRKDENGKYVNHGKFYQYDGKGRVAVEGEFRDGKRQGTWIQYDEKGQKIAKKWFHKGIELPGEVPRGVTDDAYLQAVEEQKKAVHAPQFQFKKIPTSTGTPAPSGTGESGAPLKEPAPRPTRPGPQI